MPCPKWPSLSDPRGAQLVCYWSTFMTVVITISISNWPIIHSVWGTQWYSCLETCDTTTWLTGVCSQGPLFLDRKTSWRLGSVPQWLKGLLVICLPKAPGSFWDPDIFEDKQLWPFPSQFPEWSFQYSYYVKHLPLGSIPRISLSWAWRPASYLSLVTSFPCFHLQTSAGTVQGHY